MSLSIRRTTYLVAVLIVFGMTFGIEKVRDAQLRPRALRMLWRFRHLLYLGMYMRAGSCFEFRKRRLELFKLAVVVGLAFSRARHGDPVWLYSDGFVSRKSVRQTLKERAIVWCAFNQYGYVDEKKKRFAIVHPAIAKRPMRPTLPIHRPGLETLYKSFRTCIELR